MSTVTAAMVFEDTGERSEKVIDRDGETYVVSVGWFKLREAGHSKRGLQFGFPLEHPDYNEGTQEALLSSSEGKYMKLQLVSLNSRQTAWRVYEIVDEEVQRP